MFSHSHSGCGQLLTVATATAITTAAVAAAAAGIKIRSFLEQFLFLLFVIVGALLGGTNFPLASSLPITKRTLTIVWIVYPAG